MSVLIIVSVGSLLALLAALPGDFARRGGSGSIVALGALANAVLLGRQPDRPRARARRLRRDRCGHDRGQRAGRSSRQPGLGTGRRQLIGSPKRASGSDHGGRRASSAPSECSRLR